MFNKYFFMITIRNLLLVETGKAIIMCLSLIGKQSFPRE